MYLQVILSNAMIKISDGEKRKHDMVELGREIERGIRSNKVEEKTEEIQ